MKKWIGIILSVAIVAGVLLASSGLNSRKVELGQEKKDDYIKTETGTSAKSTEKKKIAMDSFKKASPIKSYKDGELLIKFAENMSDSKIKKFLDEKRVFIEKEVVEHLYLVRFSTKENTMGVLLSEFNTDKNIVFAEPNYVRKKSQRTPENNFYFNTQWGLLNEKNKIDIDVMQAWEITKGSPSIVVGVIDSGIEKNHVDIANNIWENPGEIAGNGIDDDKNGYIDDVTGWNFLNEDSDSNDKYEHGTHVSGIIAAEDNQKGIVGVAPNIRLAALKVGDDSFDTVDIVEAIHYGGKEGIKIFNCSYSSADFSNSELDAMRSTDALFVCAAGNDGLNVDKDMIYPACYKIDNIISVGAVDSVGNVPDFSNYGAKNVDIAAPGVDIQSLVLSNEYGYGDGTSMAAPFVTGVAALVSSMNKSLGPLEIKKVILDNGRVLPSLNKKVAKGLFLDAYAAVKAGMSKETILVKTISINKKSLSVLQNKKAHLKAIIDPWDATNQKVSWTSSNKEIATVDFEGYIFAAHPGKATITATVKGETEDVTATCEVTVTEPIQSVYSQGDKFRLKILAPTVVDGKNTVSFIKPDGELAEFEGNAVADTEEKSGYYYVDIKVDNDGVLGKNEINPQYDFGTWELDSINVNPTYETNMSFVNEKYYKSAESGIYCIYMDDSKFAVKGLRGELLDNTKNITKKSLTVDGPDKPIFGKIEVSKKEALRGNSIFLKVYAKDTFGIWYGKVIFQRPDGTEATYSLNRSSRDGYYYCNLVVNRDGVLKKNEIDSTKYAGVWKVKSVELANLNGISEFYFNREYYTITGVLDMTNAEFKVVNNSVSIESLKLYRTSGIVYTGRSYRLVYDTFPKDCTFYGLNWKSSNQKVATVSKTGVIMGKNSGSATILGTTRDGAAIKLSFNVNVKKYYYVSKITAPRSITLKVGKSTTIKTKLTPYYSTSKKLIWSVLKPGIVKVDGKGKITGLKKGKATVKVKAGDGSGKYALCYITIK